MDKSQSSLSIKISQSSSFLQEKSINHYNPPHTHTLQMKYREKTQTFISVMGETQCIYE